MSSLTFGPSKNKPKKGKGGDRPGGKNDGRGAHQQHGGGKPNKGKGGKGGKGDGKPNKGKGGNDVLNDRLMDMATAQAKHDTFGEQQAIQSEIGRASKHIGVMDSAFDAYAQRVAAIQGAQAAGYAAAAQGQTDRASQLMGASGGLALQEAGDAAQTAGILGQDNGVAAQIGQAAAGGMQAQGAQAMNQGNLMAALGLADSTNLDRVGLIGERDRIGALEEAEDYRRGAQEDLRGLKRDQEDEAMDRFAELWQFMKGHRLAAKGQKFDQKMRGKEFRLARKELLETLADSDADRAAELQMNAEDNATDLKENKQDNRGDGGSGGDDYGGKLSPSEKEEVNQLNNKIQSVISIYRQAIRNGKSPTQAAKQARGKAGQDQWMAVIARQVVNSNGLNAQGRKIVKGHYPAGILPKFLR